jgi:ABC-type Na+ transport system ATPase subunit NatA
MSETIRDILKRKIKNAQERLEQAKIYKANALADVTAKCDRAIALEEGRIAALENLEELDWKLYAQNELEKP